MALSNWEVFAFDPAGQAVRAEIQSTNNQVLVYLHKVSIWIKFLGLPDISPAALDFGSLYIGDLHIYSKRLEDEWSPLFFMAAENADNFIVGCAAFIDEPGSCCRSIDTFLWYEFIVWIEDVVTDDTDCIPLFFDKSWIDTIKSHGPMIYNQGGDWLYQNTVGELDSRHVRTLDLTQPKEEDDK